MMRHTRVAVNQRRCASSGAAGRRGATTARNEGPPLATQVARHRRVLQAPLMADFKVPRQVRIVDDFPLTSTGKIRRAELAARAAEAP